ncbi:hypothetical protein ECZU03_12370 [Escherichia coli]|nr:hypothetical protein ECZU03_12370 [Escherichia coli]
MPAALSNQHVLEEKTVAGWVAENQTALLYLMTREQRAVRHQGESDMAGSRWYWRTTPLSTGNALLGRWILKSAFTKTFRR